MTVVAPAAGDVPFPPRETVNERAEPDAGRSSLLLVLTNGDDGDDDHCARVNLHKV